MERTEETNIEKLLFFTGSIRGAKAQETEVTLRFSTEEIKVVLTYAEVGFLMRGLYEAAKHQDPGTASQIRHSPAKRKMTTAEHFDDRFLEGEDGVLLEAMNQATAITSNDEAIEPDAGILQAAHRAGKRVMFEFNDGSLFAVTMAANDSALVEVGSVEYEIKFQTPISELYNKPSVEPGRKSRRKQNT